MTNKAFWCSHCIVWLMAVGCGVSLTASQRNTVCFRSKCQTLSVLFIRDCGWQKAPSPQLTTQNLFPRGDACACRSSFTCSILVLQSLNQHEWNAFFPLFCPPFCKEALLFWWYNLNRIVFTLSFWGGSWRTCEEWKDGHYRKCCFGQRDLCLVFCLSPGSNAVFYLMRS